jgi:hypothetical protein
VPYVAGVLAAPPQGYALDEGVVVLVVEEDVVLGGEQLPRVRCFVGRWLALLVLYLLYLCFNCFTSALLALFVLYLLYLCFTVVLGGEQLPRVRCSVCLLDLLRLCFTGTKVQILTRAFKVQGA